MNWASLTAGETMRSLAEKDPRCWCRDADVDQALSLDVNFHEMRLVTLQSPVERIVPNPRLGKINFNNIVVDVRK